MKLLDTIKKLVQEAEDAYYEASRSNTNPKVLEKLEEKLESSMKLLEMFEDLK
mgnify:CR=1 FL=1|jgi:uncharacterized membrane protein (DUF106 family)